MKDYIKREPVRFWAMLTGIVVALIPVLTLFNLIEWTPEQIAGIVALFAACGVAFQAFFVRDKVTPVD